MTLNDKNSIDLKRKKIKSGDFIGFWWRYCMVLNIKVQNLVSYIFIVIVRETEKNTFRVALLMSFLTTHDYR